MKISKDKGILNVTLGVIIFIAVFFLIFGIKFIEFIFFLFLLIGVIYVFKTSRGKYSTTKSIKATRRQKTYQDKKNQTSETQAISTLTLKQREELVNRWEKFGVKDALCPSCNSELSKFPKRKIKCKNCKKNINKGTNYITGTELLYSDKNVPLYEELLWLSNGTWNTWFDSFDEIEAMKKELANLNKHEGDPENIPLNDAIWGKIQRNLDNLLNQGDWANYLLTLESGVVFFNRENKIKAALPIIYQLIYLSYIVSPTYGTEYEKYDVLPKQMSTGGISFLAFITENIPNFDENYHKYIQQTDLPAIFKKDSMRSLEQYKVQKDSFIKEYQKRRQKSN